MSSYLLSLLRRGLGGDVPKEREVVGVAPWALA